MNRISSLGPLRATPRHRASLGTLSLAVATALLVACGGGSADAPAGVPTSTTTSVLVSGPISGFGSIIIGGMRLDDSGATITDDSGRNLAESELRLGMQCDVSGDDHGGGRGSAQTVLVHSALVGAVEAVDTAAGTLTVLEQTVVLDARTAFDDNLGGGLAGVAAGDVVEIHAQFDPAAGVYRATRVEREDAAAQFKIRGIVTGLDAVAKTLQIGATRIAFGSVTGVPSTLAVGSLVDARLQTTPVAGVWTAIRIEDGQRQRGDHDEAHLRGTVTAFTSATQFSVDGTPVDASGATFGDGQAVVALGVELEVEGRLANGVLVASSVALEDDHRGNGHGADDGAVELHGTISLLDTARQTFTVRATRVSYAGSVEFRDGSAASLVDGLFVEVKGDLSADGTLVEATSIELNPDD